jgi:hypothetical protein
MSEYPTATKAELDELLITLDLEYKSWEANGMDEKGLVDLFNAHSKTYQLVQNSSTQEALDAITERYEWAYPFFQTLNDILDHNTTGE